METMRLTLVSFPVSRVFWPTGSCKQAEQIDVFDFRRPSYI